jgi:uncharacterized protein (DUF1697 family)
MPRYVAFLRAINVGGRRVKMEDLAAIFRNLGFKDAETFIASGNVIFSSPAKDRAALERKIEKTLEAELGYVVETFIRTYSEIAAFAEFPAFPSASNGGDEKLAVHVVFLRAPLEAEVAALVPGFRTEVDDFNLQGAELYWLSRAGVAGSLVNWNKFAKAIRAPSTARNQGMLKKLLAKHPA